MNYVTYRKEIYATTQKLVKAGLIRISSGNVSMRTDDGNVAITPSSIPYDELDYSDIVILDMEGNTVDGKLKPSVEKMLHINSYKARTDINAVIHTHSISAITLSLVGAEIPPVSMELVALGAPIPTLGFSFPGTIEFAEKVSGYFKKFPAKNAVILENHGSVAVGKNIKDAFQNAYNFETGATIYYRTLLFGKKIKVLSENEMNEIKNA